MPSPQTSGAEGEMADVVSSQSTVSGSNRVVKSRHSASPGTAHVTTNHSSPSASAKQGNSSVSPLQLLSMPSPQISGRSRLIVGSLSLQSSLAGNPSWSSSRCEGDVEGVVDGNTVGVVVGTADREGGLDGDRLVVGEPLGARDGKSEGKLEGAADGCD